MMANALLRGKMVGALGEKDSLKGVFSVKSHLKGKSAVSGRTEGKAGMGCRRAKSTGHSEMGWSTAFPSHSERESSVGTQPKQLSHVTTCLLGAYY